MAQYSKIMGTNYETTQPCPNRKCGNLNAVFLTLDDMPAMGDWYTYICPRCNEKVVFQVGAVTVNVGIPDGAILAEPYKR